MRYPRAWHTLSFSPRCPVLKPQYRGFLQSKFDQHGTPRPFPWKTENSKLWMIDRLTACAVAKLRTKDFLT